VSVVEHGRRSAGAAAGAPAGAPVGDPVGDPAGAGLDREAARVAALHDLEVLDRPADPELDAVVRLVTAVTGLPMATLNLLDSDRQCQLVTAGFVGGDSARSDSMCAVHFLDGDLVHVEDAAADARFAANPWVDGRMARVRSYASAPLVLDGGHVLGTLCAFDEHPRRLGAAQLAGLQDLARVVVALLERHRETRRLELLALETEEQRALVDLLLADAESRQEFTDAVLDTADVAVVACDPQGRLTLFNRAAHDWHGAYPDGDAALSDSVERFDLFEVDGTTPLPLERVPLRRALVEGRVVDAEIAIAVPGRPPVIAVCSGRSLLGADGRLLGAVVVMSDVTADRAQRAELERSNADLEHFAGIAGHDLAAPLSVVGGYLELLADEAGDALDERARGWVATTRASVTRMQGLISALLTYSRAGGAVPSHQPVDTQALVELALADLATTVARGAAEVEATGLPVVAGDPVQLRQLLQNLVANAVQHRSPDRPCRVRVSAARTAQGWELAVADNGPGVPPEQRDAVFTMFTTGGAGRGHGIGLATCQRIVAHHGGRIWVDETPGGGATVRFTLPAV
jgi:signal transduction histidine kinase